MCWGSAENIANIAIHCNKYDRYILGLYSRIDISQLRFAKCNLKLNQYWILGCYVEGSNFFKMLHNLGESPHYKVEPFISSSSFTHFNQHSSAGAANLMPTIVICSKLHIPFLLSSNKFFFLIVIYEEVDIILLCGCVYLQFVKSKLSFFSSHILLIPKCREEEDAAPGK